MLHLCSNWVNRPIIIFEYFLAKYIRGGVIIQNVPHFSKIYINTGFEAASLFCRRLCDEGIQIEEEVRFTSQRTIQMNMKDDMLNMHPRKTISELNESNENSVCITHAGIVSILRDQPWTYPSCMCHAELIVRTGVYECVRCQRFFYKMLRRYRIQVEVYDGYKNAMFFLNDAQVKEVINLAPPDLLFRLDCDVDVDYPSEVEEKVIGKSMLFKVSKIPGLTLKGYPCYEVLRVCSDHEIISVFISQARSISSAMVTDGEGQHSGHDGSQGESSSAGVSKFVKRKLLVGASELSEDSDHKLMKIESKVGDKGEISSLSVSNGEDDMLGEINRLKAIKISDDGSYNQSSFLPSAGFSN